MFFCEKIYCQQFFYSSSLGNIFDFCVVLAGMSFAVAMVVAPGQRLLVALLLFVACLVVRHVLHRRGILHSADEAAEGGAQ